MSFEEGRAEFIKAGLKAKRADDLALAAALLTGPTLAMPYPTVTYMVGIVILMLVFYMIKISKVIFSGRSSSISIIYSLVCALATLLNFYLGMILIILAHQKFASTHKAQAKLPANFKQAIQDPRYASMILNIGICFVLMLIYSFKILPPTLEKIQ